jgi:SH3 domain-containing YSC84-like protein 1
MNRLQSAANRHRPAVLCAAALLGVLVSRPLPAAPADDPDPAALRLIEQAQAQVADAAALVRRMRGDAELALRLQQARAVLLVPRFAKGALLVGGAKGAGVLIAREQAGWSDPAFYSVHGMSIGLQAGGARGALAMLLMSDKALETFRSNDHTWTLNGGAGLTIASFTDRPLRQVEPDVIVWSEVTGLFAGLAVNALGVTPNDAQNQAYYQSPVAPLQILIGAASNPRAAALREALDTRLAAE